MFKKNGKNICIIIVAAMAIFATAQCQTKGLLGTRKLYKEMQRKVRSNEWVSFTVVTKNNVAYPYHVICHYTAGTTDEVVVIRQQSIARQTNDTAIRIDFQRENYEVYTKKGSTPTVWNIHRANATNIYPFGFYNDFTHQEKPNRSSEVTIRGKKYICFDIVEENKTYDGPVMFDTAGNVLSHPEKISIDHTLLFANKETGIIDSISFIEEFDEPYEYKIKDLSFANRRRFIDSLLSPSLYKNYDFFDDIHTPHQTIPIGYNADRLSDTVLDHLLVGVNGDSTSLRNMLGQWLLLDFCMTGCRPCFEQLERFQKERDSTGLYALEKHGIKLLFINSTTWRLDLVKAVQDKFQLPNSYAAKGLIKYTAFPANPGYVLISPIGDVVYKSRSLGDYSSLLEAKRKYENTRQ